jgi:hypothetical protein
MCKRSAPGPQIPTRLRSLEAIDRFGRASVPLGEPGAAAKTPELCIKRLPQCSARAGGRRSIDKIIRSRPYPTG